MWLGSGLAAKRLSGVCSNWTGVDGGKLVLLRKKCSPLGLALKREVGQDWTKDGKGEVYLAERRCIGSKYIGR